MHLSVFSKWNGSQSNDLSTAVFQFQVDTCTCMFINLNTSIYTLVCLLRVEWFRKTDLNTALFKSTHSSVFSKWNDSHKDWINLSSILLSSRWSSQSTTRGDAVL